jgi:preprotein translocase subunit YajC
LIPHVLSACANLTPAFAPPTDGGQSNPLAPLFLFVPFLLIFYFLIWRPQAKRQKEHKAMLESLKKGDRVVTNGGLYATVLNVKEEEGVVVATIAENVKVEIARHAISNVAQKKK